MEEKVKISLERYDKLKEKEATYDNLVSEMEALKVSTKKEVEISIEHILKFSANIFRNAKVNQEIINDCARQAGFTAIYNGYGGGQTQVGDGSGKVYEIEAK